MTYVPEYQRWYCHYCKDYPVKPQRIVEAEDGVKFGVIFLIIIAIVYLPILIFVFPMMAPDLGGICLIIGILLPLITLITGALFAMGDMTENGIMIYYWSYLGIVFFPAGIIATWYISDKVRNLNDVHVVYLDRKKQEKTIVNVVDQKIQDIQPESITPDTTKIRLVRESELFKGFIRAKIAIINEMNSVITDIAFRLIYDKKTLSIAFIEPSYKLVGDIVDFESLNAGEKKTIAFYLDPLICMESFIDGTLTFKDFKGNISTTNMKKLRIEIVCPIFLTEENINVAMLRNLLYETLIYHDSKVYYVPSGLSTKNAFDLCKEVIQAHNVKFVRDIIEDHPYIGEGWYYGKTKVKKNELIIRTRVMEETNTIELFVASIDQLSLTGLLAELGHDLDEKLRQKGIIERPIHQITNITIKDSVIHRSSLLFGTTVEVDMAKDISGDINIEDSVVLKSDIGATEPSTEPERSEKTKKDDKYLSEYEKMLWKK